MFRQKTLLTFDQLKAAFQPFGLPVEETRGDNHSSAVKIVHDGVPYKPAPDLKGPHALVLEKSEWARKLPLVENIEVRCWDKSIKHTPPEIPLAPARTPNPYGAPIP